MYLEDKGQVASRSVIASKSNRMKAAHGECAKPGLVRSWMEVGLER